MPAQPAKMPVMRALRSRVMHGKCGARHPAADQREKDESGELSSEDSSYQAFSVWDWSLSTLSCASSAILSHAVKPTNPIPPADDYLGTSDSPVTSTDYCRLLAAE